MVKLLLFIVFLIVSCTSDKIDTVNIDPDFQKEMTFDEFKIKLEDYAENSAYPNIDN